MKDKEDIRAFIRKNYTKVALEGSKGGGCCSSGCGCGGAPLDINEASVRIGYSEDEKTKVP